NYALNTYSCTSSGGSTLTDNLDGTYTIAPAGNDVITCTYDNLWSDPGVGEIQIFKSTLDGSSGGFDFVINDEFGTEVYSETIFLEEGGNSGVKTSYAAGIDYTVSEIVPPGFTLVTSSCTSTTGDSTFVANGDGSITVSLATDDFVRCFFDNTSS
ncbi:hypothetical protein, partial [Nitrosopumilus sp.]|uniref:prealbumin-like fold domain-containing protein n=1 Tax=Nitrosopumilus sp. TaxID=2024843 RepID=UPI0026106EBA